jgi:hypothetical protein
VPTFKDIGEPERGFAVLSKRTSSGNIKLPGWLDTGLTPALAPRLATTAPVSVESAAHV